MSATIIETEIEIRSGEGFDVAEVNFPKRLVTVVAMPYEKPAEIIERGRVFTEVVSRGAFDGVEKRTRQIRANRDHSWEKVAGKILALHPSRKEGLVAEVEMFRTTIGEETLRLCDQGGLDASAGFKLLRRPDGRVHDDAEVWERNRTVRRLNRLRLDHLAFVPNPAYEDAIVIDVRQQAEPGPVMPNRDRLALELVVEQQKATLEEINRRLAPLGFWSRVSRLLSR